MDLKKIYDQSVKDNYIPNEYYSLYGVKKGLRNENGTGVLIGLTRIADVVGYKKDEEGSKIDTEGDLYYRGISIRKLIEKLQDDAPFMYEKTAFLLLFGHLPNDEEYECFIDLLKDNCSLPEGFMATNILRQPSINVMNKIQRALLMLYSEDENADDASAYNTLMQGISILAKLPAIIVYSYQAKAHFIDNGSLIIHQYRSDKSIAENILRLLRSDTNYLPKEAEVLDLMLVIHADHGSGNNSTFTNLVVSSTGTDIYSSLSASVGSLKGPRHGGANITCRKMMKEVIEEIGLCATDEEIAGIVKRMLNKDFFDKSGLVYGMGHAVYTLSDPRCELLKEKFGELAKEKGDTSEFDFYCRFERIAKETFLKEKGRRICANVDFYSGLVYEYLGVPQDLFTPMFAMSRMVGWIAHNIEDKLYCNKIIRPAGKYVGDKEI